MNKLIQPPIDGRHKVTPIGKHDMTNKEYHADRHYFSSSQIKSALTSPAHFKYYVLDKGSKHEPTSAMELGTLIHLVCLEPHLFDETYVVYSGDCNRDGTVPKASAKILENKYPGLTAISQKWYDMAIRARRNFEGYQAASDLLFDKSTEYEVSYFADCPETGLKLRVRPDAICLEKNVIIDLKTTYCTTKQEFVKDAKYKYHYDLSAFMYQYVVYLLTGKVCDFYFYTVTKEQLVPVSVYKASQAFLDEGKAKFYKACDNIRTALTLPDDYKFQSEFEEI